MAEAEVSMAPSWASKMEELLVPWAHRMELGTASLMQQRVRIEQCREADEVVERGWTNCVAPCFFIVS